MPVIPKPEPTETPSSKAAVLLRTEISSNIVTLSFRSYMIKASVLSSELILPSRVKYLPELIKGYSLSTGWLEMRVLSY